MKTKHKLDAYYMKKYGITWATRMVIWRVQKGRCAICGKHERNFKKRLAVDHNHKTGNVRGLLCFYCNKFRVGRLDSYWANLVCQYLDNESSMWHE